MFVSGSLTYAFCVLFLFLVLRLCIYIFLFLKKILLFKIYLLRSVFYVRFCLSVGFVHGTYCLFDSKIFTRMCLSVGPNVCVLRPFYFWCCVCAFTFTFSIFFFLKIYLLRSVFYVRFCLSVGLVHGTHYLFDSKIFTRMCLSVGPQRLRFASFFIFGVAFVRLRFPFFFFFNLFIKKCVLREILSVSGSCAWNLLSL